MTDGDPITPDATTDASPAETAPAALPVVLVVDDEESILRSIKRLLRKCSCEVVLATGGAEALAILAERDVAVIVCDQRMPGMTGAEVLERSVELSPESYRITLTGYTDLTSAQRSINQGKVHHFLCKPWDDDVLRSVVEDGLEAHRFKREHRELQELTSRQRDELKELNGKLEDIVRARTKQLKVRNGELEKIRSDVEDSLRDVVLVLATMLEMYDANLGVHSKRVARLAVHLGKRLGMDDDELRELEFASILHDLGKIARISESGSNKTKTPKGPAHDALVGASILSRIRGFEEIALIVRHQREMFNGSGKPKGLAGTRIPLPCRILAVANLYDMSAFGGYKPTEVDHEAGLKALRLGSNKELDPSLVENLFAHDFFDDALQGNETEVEISPRQLRAGMVLTRDLLNISGNMLLKEDSEITLTMLERLQELADEHQLPPSIMVRCTIADDSAALPSDNPGESKRCA